MLDILTITLNPAIDLSTTTDQVEPDRKLRCARATVDPGGGGINVSRAIHILGGQSRALVALGGHNGDKLCHLLTDEGIAYLPFRTTGETRQSLAVTDDATGQQYRFVMPGPDWSNAQQNALLAMVPDVAPEYGLVILSGSQPPGVATNLTRHLCKSLAGRGTEILVDVSGGPLADLTVAADAPISVLRMDQDEAETLNGSPLPTREDSGRFARSLVDKGVAGTIIVARGADGSVLVSEGQALHAAAVDVPVNSKVGAGDSFVGAFALSLARGEETGAALQKATAAASSAVTTGATRLCTREDAERFAPQCQVTALRL